MNHHSRLLFTLLVTALASGCASHATLRILSEPQGAYITDDSGRLLGTTPLEVSYPIDTNAGTCIETDSFSALWVSGVEAEIPPIVLCEAGYASTLIHRGFSQPGLAEDRAFAVQLEMLELQRQQTVATQQAADASWAAAAAARDAANAARRSARSGYPQNQQRERNYRDNERGQERREDSSRAPESSAVNHQDRSRNQIDQPARQTVEPLATEALAEEAGVIAGQETLVQVEPAVVEVVSEPAVEPIAESAVETVPEPAAETADDTTDESPAETVAEPAV